MVDVVDGVPPPERSRQAGYELRDVSIAVVVGSALLLVLGGVALTFLLWGIYRLSVAGHGEPGVSPPVVMPGDAPVNDRIRSVPQPRLDPLVPLEAQPASYRSSLPVPKTSSPPVRPQDLQPGRQPRLQGYEWIEKGKTARIPIDQAMDAVAEQANKGGKK